MNRAPLYVPADAHHYCVADHPFTITFVDYEHGERLLPSFKPFLTGSGHADELLFSLIVDDKTQPVPKAERRRIRDFDTGNGVTIVDKLNDGGYRCFGTP